MTKPDDSTTSPAERQRGGRILRSPFILAILSVVAFFWVVTGAVIAIDPLDLYDWGAPPRLLPDYNRHTNREMYMVSSSSIHAVAWSSVCSVKSSPFSAAKKRRSASSTMTYWLRFV